MAGATEEEEELPQTERQTDTASWEVSSLTVLGIALVLPIIISGIAFNIHSNSEWIGADPPNYQSIFAGTYQIGDFYSDLIFCAMLFWEDDPLVTLCVVFTFLPHIISNVFALYQMYQWRQYTIYLANYVNKYDFFIIFISAVASFYTYVWR